MSYHTGIFHILTIGLLCLQGAAMANGMPRPPAPWQIERAQKIQAGVVDEVDQYCDGKKPKDACMLPGTPLHGGGEGLCLLTGRANIIGSTITTLTRLTCYPKQMFHSQSVIADVLMQADAAFCNTIKDPTGAIPIDTHPNLKVTCTGPVTVTDQFCKDKTVGQSCVAKGRLTEFTERSPLSKQSFPFMYMASPFYYADGQPYEYASSCKAHNEVHKFRISPQSKEHEATRTVISCSDPRTEPEYKFREVKTIEKMLK